MNYSLLTAWGLSPFPFTHYGSWCGREEGVRILASLYFWWDVAMMVKDGSLLQLSLQGTRRAVCHWKSHYGFILTKISSVAFTVLVLEITFLKPFPFLKSEVHISIQCLGRSQTYPGCYSISLILAKLYYFSHICNLQWVEMKWISHAELVHLYKPPQKYFHGWINNNYKSLTF